MHKKYLLIALSLMILPMLISTGVFAGKEVKEIVTFDNPAYGKHKEAIVSFNHKKHSSDYYDEYPELYESTCGECHHDKENKKQRDTRIACTVCNACCIESAPCVLNHFCGENDHHECQDCYNLLST